MGRLIGELRLPVCLPNLSVLLAMIALVATLSDLPAQPPPAPTVDDIQQSEEMLKRLQMQLKEEFHAGHYRKAIASAQKALAVRKTLYGADSPRFAIGLNNLAEMYREQGEYSKAGLAYTEAADILTRQLPAEHPQLLALQMNRGLLACDIGDFATAESLLSRAVDTAAEAKEYNPLQHALALNNLGRLYRDRGDPKQSKQSFTDAERIVFDAFGPDHAFLGTIWANLAESEHEIGDTAQADKHYELAFKSLRKVYGEKHIAYALALNNRADICRASGELEKANSMFDEALAIAKQSPGENHPTYALILANKAWLLVAANDLSEAEKSLDKASSVIETTVGDRHPYFARVTFRRGEVLRRTGRLAEAIAALRKAVDLSGELYGREHYKLLEPLQSYAKALRDDRDFVKAAEVEAQIEILKIARSESDGDG